MTAVMTKTLTETRHKNFRDSGEITISSLSLNRKESHRNRIGIALSSVFSIEKLFNSIVNITTDVLEVRSASIMLIEDKDLVIKSSKHLPMEIVKEARAKVGNSIAGSVALSGKPLFIENIENNTIFKKLNSKRYSTKSFITVPIINNNSVIIGVINAGDKHNNGPLTNEDLKLLKIISQYSAVAIRNALLIKKTKKRTVMEELNTFYKDDDNKFLPVTIKSLVSGPFSTSELFLENNINGKKKYVLYWKGGNASDAEKSRERIISNEKRAEFINKNINKLFVEKNGRVQYLRFVETQVDKIVKDNNIELKEKYKIIKDVVCNIIKDTTTAHDGICDVERLKPLVNIMVDLVLDKDRDTYGLIKDIENNSQYSERYFGVAELGMLFGDNLSMNVDELNKLGIGLLLQDIGMREIDNLILNKTGKLNEDEFGMIKKHPEAGFQVLQNTGLLAIESLLPAAQHHENFDGSGYPYGLKGHNIDYRSRVSRVVDVYVALTTDRPYADANTPEKARMIMEYKMKGAFDPDILNSFIKFLKSTEIIKNNTLV